MSQQNIQVIQGAFSDFGKGDVAGILGRLSDDVQWREFDNADIPYAGKRVGKAAVKGFFEAIAGAIDVSEFNPAEFIDAGDKVVVLGHWAGTVRSTGKRFTSRWAMVWTLKSGKATHFDCYEDMTSTAAAFR